MAPPDPAIISEGISRFLQVAQERAYAEKINCFEEIVRSLQAANTRLQEHHSQEMSASQAILKSLQASIEKSEADNAKVQAHHSQEISSLQTDVRSLRGSTKNAETDISKLQQHLFKEFNSLRKVADSLEGFAEKAEADNNQLQGEIGALRARLGHTGDLSVEGDAARTHRPPQSGTKQQEPSQRPSLHSHFAGNTDEQHGTKTISQFPPSNGHSRKHRPKPSRQRAQQYPRGTKRTHVEDTAELPHQPTPTEEAGNIHVVGQPRGQKTHQSKRSDRKRMHDEPSGREESGKSQMKDRSVVRHDEFVAYYHSMRREHKNNQGKDQSAVVRRFIDGIPDPDYLSWFQDALKELFPESVHDAKRPELIRGNRTITLKNDLTWEAVRTVVKDIRIPYFAD